MRLLMVRDVDKRTRNQKIDIVKWFANEKPFARILGLIRGQATEHFG